MASTHAQESQKSEAGVRLSPVCWRTADAAQGSYRQSDFSMAHYTFPNRTLGTERSSGAIRSCLSRYRVAGFHGGAVLSVMLGALALEHGAGVHR